MAESEYNGKPGKWRTVKGRKVFFPDGEDEKAVINEAFGDDYKPSKKRINKGKFEKSDDGENWDELEDSQSYNDYYGEEDEFDLNEDEDFEEGKLKIQVKYDGKQIEMEIPSNIEEDWQVDEAVKEKLEQIEGHEVENFEWDIAENEPEEEPNPMDEFSGPDREGPSYAQIQNREEVEGIANSEEDEAASPYKEADRQWMKNHIEDNPDMSDKDLMDNILERFGELSPDDEQFVKQLLAGRHNKESTQLSDEWFPGEAKMHLTRSIKNALEKEPNLSLNGYMKEHSKDGNIPNFLKLIGLENSDFKGTDALSDIYNALNEKDEAGRNKGPQAAAAGGGQPPEDDLDILVNEYTEAKKSNDLERLAKAKAKLRNYLLGKPIEDQEGSPMAEFKKQTR